MRARVHVCVRACMHASHYAHIHIASTSASDISWSNSSPLNIRMSKSSDPTISYIIKYNIKATVHYTYRCSNKCSTHHAVSQHNIM